MSFSSGVAYMPTPVSAIPSRVPPGTAHEIRLSWVREIGAAYDDPSVTPQLVRSRVAQSTTRGILRGTPPDVAEACRLVAYDNLVSDEAAIDDAELIARVSYRIATWPHTYEYAAEDEARRLAARRQRQARRTTFEELAHGQDPHLAEVAGYS
jgi:enoyl-CoA hydratase/carnithine racemase